MAAAANAGVNTAPTYPPPINLRLLRTVKEMDAAQATATRPLLLIMRADWCARCPAFGNEVATLATEYQFEYCYTNADDTELTEHFQVIKLPAFVLSRNSGDDVLVMPAAAPRDVRLAVESCCEPVLNLVTEF